MTMGRRSFATCLVLTTMLTASLGQSSSASQSVDQDREAIAVLRDQYATTWKTGKAERLALLYADDGVVLYPNGPAVAGRSAILEYFKSFYDQFTPSNFELTSDEVTVAGSWAFDRGTYKLSMSPKGGGEAINDHGKYLVILQRQAGGGWKVARDMDNSSAAISYAGNKTSSSQW